MKKFTTSFLLVSILSLNSVTAFGDTDSTIFIDKINDTYIGTKNAQDIIKNIKFTDVPKNHWAKKSIVHAAALNMIKGYNNKYNPTKAVSNEEAIAFLIRFIGLEQIAQNENNLIKNSNAQASWSSGYLKVARDIGLITNEQYNNSIKTSQNSTSQNLFSKTSPVTREQIASWLVYSINYLKGQDNPLIAKIINKVYNFSDYSNIGLEHINNVEICLDNGFMSGVSDNKFKPKDFLTRSEIAQILANTADIYNEIFGLEKKVGTIIAIKDVQENKSGNNVLKRNIFVRNNDSLINNIQYELADNFFKPSLRQRCCSL